MTPHTTAPPTPRGATSAEQQAINRIHRAADVGELGTVRRELGAAPGLIVELMGDRRSWPSDTSMLGQSDGCNPPHYDD